jgi:hypothetical protein
MEGWSSPSRKHIPNVFCKFPTSAETELDSMDQQKTSLAGSKTGLAGFIGLEQADRAT